MADPSIIQTALDRGYTHDEIADILATDAGFDPKEIRGNGYTSVEILGRLGYELPKAPENGDFMRGATTAAKQLPQLGYGLMAGAGAVAESAFGEGGISSAVKEYGVRKFQEIGADIQKDAKETDSLTHSWERAKQGDYGAMVDWLQYGLGYGGVQALEALASGGIGAVLGKATLKGTAEHLASGMVAKEVARIGAAQESKALAADVVQRMAVANVAANIGAKVGIGAQAFGMEGGEIMGGLAEQSAKRGSPLTGDEIARGLGATLAAGSLEFIGDKIGVDLMLGKSSMFKPAAGMTGIGGRAARAGVAAAGAIPVESGTEYFQTGLEEWGQGKEANALPWNQSPEAQRQAFDAAGLGAVGGGAMAVGGGLLTPPSAQPSIPRATPEDVAAAETPQAAAAAVADMGAGIAAPISESIASTQAEIDALLTDPISSQPTGAIDAQAQEAVTPEARPQAPAAAVTDFIAQGENGRWALSRPINNQPPEVVSAIIDELDRLNSQGDTASGGLIAGERAPESPALPTGGQDGQRQKTAEVLTEPAAANTEIAAAATQEAKLQAQYQAAATEANDPRLTDGERKLAEAKVDAALDALGEVTQGAEKPITRIKGGKLAITGFTREDVSESLKTAKIAALVTTGADGKVLVSATDRTGNPTEITLRQQNAITKALTGSSPTAKKPRGFTGNLRNDTNLIAPGLYAEVARGGDGDGMDIDLSLVAERLRDEGFMLPTVETGKDSDAVIELIRQDLANGGGTLNEARATAALEEESAKKHRQDVLRMASEYGVETKRGIIPRRLEDVEADLEAAIEDELGVSGRGVVSAYDAAIAAGISEKEADAIIDRIAEGYTGDTARDAWVRQYRDQANALQEAIDAKEREGRSPEAEDAAETPVEAEERPALDLAGQSEAEIRDEEARIAEAKAAEEAEARKAEEQARREKAERDKADMQKRLENQPFEFGVGAKEAKKPQRDIFSSPVDAAAHEAATSPTNDKPAPTPGQMEAGNYAKGHIRLHGFDISIENPKGSERVAKDGSWRVPSMPAHYGYIKGTIGADKDHLDVFVGPNPESSTAWVINQVVADSSPAKFDEHKVMIGFDSADEAKKAYLDSFEKGYGARVFGSMTGALTIDELKAKIESGELSRKKFVGPVEGGTDAQREKQGYNEPAGPVAPIANETASSEAVSLSEVLKLAEGKTVSRQVVIAETGQTMTLNNQDAVATIKQINSDIQALEALRLCIGG